MRNFYLQKPSSEISGRFLATQGALGFTYAEVGATATLPPAGYKVDRTRIELGAGQGVYDAAKAALRRWQQFRLGWVDVWSTETPLETGQIVAILGWAAGVWWLNSCRIIYTVNETGRDMWRKVKSVSCWNGIEVAIASITTFWHFPNQTTS
jgi:hypothetical protein